MSVTVITEWHGDILLREAMEGADLGLAYAAMAIVAEDKMNTVRQSGALARSKRTAPVLYGGDDTNESKYRDMAEQTPAAVVAQIVPNHAIAVGSWNNYAYKIEMGDSTRAATPSTIPAVDKVSAQIDQHIARGIRDKQGTI